MRDIEEAELLAESLQDKLAKGIESAILGHIPIDESRVAELLRD